MPVSSGQVATSDGYTDAATVGPYQSLASVQFTVANASVVAQVAKIDPKDNSLHWDPFETTFPPGQGGYSGKVYGIRFRSLVPGTPAVVVVNGYFEDDPVPFSSPQPFDGTLTPSGGFTPAGGIQFDTANSGGTLDVTTDTGGMDFEDTSSGILLRSINPDSSDVAIGQATGVVGIGADHSISLESAEDVFIRADSGGGFYGGLRLEAIGGANIVMNTDGGVGATIDIDSNGQAITIGSNVGSPSVDLNADVTVAAAGKKVGFFGAAPVVRQATPVTLADVIALLQAYNLSA